MYISVYSNLQFNLFNITVIEIISLCILCFAFARVAEQKNKNKTKCI